MHRYALAAGFGFALVLNFGCGSDAKKTGATKIPVKGTVKMDGNPMAKGVIIFSIPGEPGNEITITNGTFAGEANEGKNKIEISDIKEAAPAADPKMPPAKMVNLIPRKWNYDSTMTENVTAGGANDFKFSITSK